MSRPGSCRRADPPVLPGRPASAREALDVVLAASDQHRPATIALLLDERHPTCIVVERSGRHDDVIPVAELVAHAVFGGADVRAVVLASVRPGGTLDDRDVDRWFELLDVLEVAGVDVLDWFVVGDGVAASLRDLTGGPPLWGPPAPG